MKFIMTFSWKPDPKTPSDVVARFQKVGLHPPKGVKVLGRWTRADLSGGYDLLETDDTTALADLSLMWCDLMELSIVPVLEDGEVAQVFKRAVKPKAARKH
jgi:hypothetical protein